MPVRRRLEASAAPASVEPFRQLSQLLQPLWTKARRMRSRPVGHGPQLAGERERAVGRKAFPANRGAAIYSDINSLKQGLADQHRKAALLATLFAIHQDSDVELGGGFGDRRNHGAPATGRDRAAIHIRRVAVSVVEVVHLVLVDVNAVAAALLSMRNQRPTIAQLEVQIDLDVERTLIDELERPVSGKRRRTRHQVNRRFVSQFIVGALEFPDAAAFVERKYLVIPCGALPCTCKSMNAVRLRFGKVGGFGRIDRQIIEFEFVVSELRHRRMAADDLPTLFVIAAMPR